MKRALYLFLAIILGLLLSFILHALIELVYINYSLSLGRSPRGNIFMGAGWCALPVWAQYSLPIAGILGGYLIGQRWWTIVYIEKRHWRNKKR